MATIGNFSEQQNRTLAAKFIDTIEVRMPFSVRAFQVDGGSEFFAKSLSKSAPGNDLRGFIDYLDRHAPQDVLRTTREVDPIFEVTAILDRLEKEAKFPLAIFENVKGSSIPVTTNFPARDGFAPAPRVPGHAPASGE